jgi:hypothetical protein
MGKHQEAIEAYSRSMAIQPDQAQTQFNLGFALQEAGRASEAEQTFDQAANFLMNARGQSDAPLSAEAESQLSLVLLRRGDFERGWREYEARLRIIGFPVRHGFSEPMWEGSPLEGKRILLHAEQGLGDTIQFARYVPLVQSRGGKVIFQVPPALKRLFADQFAIECVLGNDDPLVPFDVQCPLGSLPYRMGTRLDTIPAAVPYLRARPQLAEAWKERLARQPGRLKAGLVWAGNPRYPQDRLRSIPPTTLSPLANAPDICFVSLQKRTTPDGNREQSVLPAMIDWTEELTDFADTAALVDRLDLVIAVDTAVAHLSGAMGKPTWLLLPEPAEWRWLMDRSDSPWYPTIRLFRQTNCGNWESVMREVLAALHAHR